MAKPYSNDLRERGSRSYPGDSTLAELKARLAKKKVKVSQSAIFRFLATSSCHSKKEPARRKIVRMAKRPVRPYGKNSQPLIRKRFVFVDETAAITR